MRSKQVAILISLRASSPENRHMRKPLEEIDIDNDSFLSLAACIGLDLSKVQRRGEMDKSASHLKAHNNCDHEQRRGTREPCPSLFPKNLSPLSRVLVLHRDKRLAEMNKSVAFRRSYDEQGHPDSESHPPADLTDGSHDDLHTQQDQSVLTSHVDRVNKTLSTTWKKRSIRRLVEFSPLRIVTQQAEYEYTPSQGQYTKVSSLPGSNMVRTKHVPPFEIP